MRCITGPWNRHRAVTMLPERFEASERFACKIVGLPCQGQVTDDQLRLHHITSTPIPPGRPWRSGLIEPFNNRVYDKRQNLNSFDHLYEARPSINNCKDERNKHHRRLGLGYETPIDYAQSYTCIQNSSPRTDRQKGARIVHLWRGQGVC